MTDLTALIRDLRAVHANVVPNVWEAREGKGYGAHSWEVIIKDLRQDFVLAEDMLPSEARYIATVHESLPRLLAALETLVAREARIRRELDAIDGDAMDSDSEYGSGMGHAADRIRDVLDKETTDGQG